MSFGLRMIVDLGAADVTKLFTHVAKKGDINVVVQVDKCHFAGSANIMLIDLHTTTAVDIMRQ